MYHVWNRTTGKFEDYQVSIMNMFELTGFIVILCSPENIYLCHEDDREACVNSVSSLIEKLKKI